LRHIKPLREVTNPENWRWIGVHLLLIKLAVSPYATEAAARRESFSENLFRSS